MKWLVTGATGFIGRRLVERLVREGEEVRVLSRRGEAAREELGLPVSAFRWDAEQGLPPSRALEGTDVVVHLAGEGVADKRWTEGRKRRILDSRVKGTRHLVEAIRLAAARPSALVAASAVGFYGDAGSEPVTERSRPGAGFLAEVCRAWEAEVERVPDGVREARIRVGVVLGAGGGALKKMLPPFRLGLGGRLGGGAQYMSWIHLDDLVSLFLHVARTSSVHGPVNGTAPFPVTNAEFTRQLGRALGRPTALPAPAPALRLLLGEMAEMLLGGQRVLPKAAEASGFRFSFPSLDAALADIVKKKA